MKWLDITDILTDGGKDLPVGRVLIFKNKKKTTHLKIMRKRNGKVWAKENYLFLPEEVAITDKKVVFDDRVRN
jgi:hypothetical protein